MYAFLTWKSYLSIVICVVLSIVDAIVYYIIYLAIRYFKMIQEGTNEDAVGAGEGN